jgi:succinate-semialdehyde dehydrogenase/glutarate-semialdehyde dehydrogenase
MKVNNPRNGMADYEFSTHSRDDVMAKAAQLRVAQPAWEQLGAAGRGAVLHKYADRIESRAGEIAAALAVDTGRRAIARMEVDGVVRNLRGWATRAPELMAALECDAVPSQTPGIEIAARYSPYPLFGAIAPWNFPLLLSHVDAIPALMAGCAALVKPSEVTPRFVQPLIDIVAELPELPLAYVMGGPQTGQALVEAVDYICFTGSTETGRKVAEAAARALIPANLELGGKDPMIVTASADPIKAAHTALRASVVATGQACQSIERIYIAQEIAEPFIESLVAAAKAVELTAGGDGSGHLGPFIFHAQAAKVAAQIVDAVSKGAKILSGGEIEDHNGGKYLRPTVLVDVTQDMAVMRDETFGPVLPVTVFADIEHAIALANETTFGLSAAVLAGSLEEAEAIGVRLDAGAISLMDGALTSMVNDATNHSRKTSGLGPSRMGNEGFYRFLRRQALIRQTGTSATIEAYKEHSSS